MKNLIAIFLIINLIASCTKEIELDFNDIEKPIVVNCLFSEDKPWELYLTKAKINNEFQDNYIGNAQVYVEADGQGPVKLNYVGNGIYSSSKQPVKDLVYRLRVEVPDYGVITARSNIPRNVELLDITYPDRQITYFFPAILQDFDVAPVSLVLKPDSSQFIRFRFYSFNSRIGYLRYQITDEVLDALRNDNVPDGCLNELTELKEEILTYNNYIREIRKIAKMCNYSLLEIKLDHVVRKFSVNIREQEAFDIGSIFPGTNWCHNISIDFRTLLGELKNEQKTDLFIDYLPALNKGNDTSYSVEYWLEVVSMDEDYYNYQKSYIQQAFQMGNPYTSQVQVHSNIENGIGIFAGYSKQMIHFYDY